ncbi:MAG: SGNH/GDSL hydrolase family protein, partial [Planctomycetes bacterium]|nr:SGNH/GDSL hydrolase family protein [Planctomycetota bacterium]
VTIDYALNDRGIGLAAARTAWSTMIRSATTAGARVLLMTPTADTTQSPRSTAEQGEALRQHATQVRALADEHGVSLVDSLAAFAAHPGDLSDLLSWSNHPNRAGHDLVARALMRWLQPA